MELPQGGVFEWQRRLLDALSGSSNVSGPFDASELFTSVRSLLSVLTIRPVHAVIRKALHLSEATLSADRLQFEHARTTERALLMETLAAWVADWPTSFQLGVSAARLTQRAFCRLKQSATLRTEVEQLPSGITRDRGYVPRVFDDELLRLARTDRRAYRALRAQRLQKLVGLA